MPTSGQPSRPFRIAAVNVNGLAEVNKRRSFFTWVQEQRHAIVLLTETHCTSDSQAQRWVQEGAGLGKPWQGLAFWCHQQQQGHRAAGGVGILLAESIVSQAEDPQVEYQGPSGRVLKVSWVTPWGQRLAALAVYAPCSAQDRPAFFLEEYLPAVTAGTQQGQIVGGDFNCVMRAEDVLAAPQQQQTASARLVGGRNLHTVNLIAGLQDSWLLKHPGKLQPTHYTQHASSHSGSEGQPQPGGMSGGRIDHIFLSEDLVNEGWLQRAHQHRRFPSDHRPVVVTLQPPNTPESGPKRWRFPNHLLGVEAFKEQLQHKLAEAATELQHRSPQLDPVAEWEELKRQAQVLTQQLQQQMLSEQRAERRRLQHWVAAARRMHQHHADTQSMQDLLAAEQSLTAFESAQLQHRVETTEPLWEVYGESSTFWFHRLGKSAPEPQFIAEVLKPDGSTVAAKGAQGIAAAGELLADFYDPATGGLFSQHPTDPQQQQAMLDSIDKCLSEEDQRQCVGEAEDGTISLHEARAALDSLPRGKTPGSDGLTYEFYTAMWEVVGPRLVAAFNYAFQQPALRLSDQQRLGLILLIYKGGGKLRADPASYRPITLLNCDLKIVAKVVVLRFGPVLDSIIDDTQTAFVPGRDIADNVLLHLEEIDYLEEAASTTRQQGCVVFLDFEKAYDRLDRDWLFKCMTAMHFPESSMRWVRLLLGGTRGRVLFNGGHLSRTFDIPSGCAQGSPLSPLLYVIAAQPLAAKCRQLQANGSVRGIRMPDGTDAPSCQQHADDTSLHAESVADIRVLLQHAVAPYCAASAAKLNVSKSKGMVLGAHPALVGPDEATGVVFVDTRTTPIKHLGVLLSVNGASAFAEQLYEQRLQSIGFRARQWARHDLSLLGRCEVARQVLASCLVYHAQFVPVPDHLMQLIQRRITAFVLGLGCIRNADNRLLRSQPTAAVASLPQQLGGIGQVDVAAHMTAMQAKVAAALLHPHRRVWKSFMRANLERAVPRLGERVLLLQTAGPAAAALRRRLKPRHAAYVAAFQALGLHRQIPQEHMTAQQVSLELLVGNHSIADAVTGSMFTSAAALPASLGNRSAGLTLGQVSNRLSFQPAVDGLVIPPAWQQLLQQGGQPSSSWLLAQGHNMVQHVEDAARHWYDVLPDGSLSYQQEPPTQLQDADLVPCCVVYATKGGPRKAQAQQQQHGQPLPAESVYYLVGPWSEVRVDPSVWWFGETLSIQKYTVKAATQRLLQLNCKQLPGWVPQHGMRPRLWRDREGNLSPDTALADLELRQKRKFAELLEHGFRDSSSSRFSEEVVAAAVHANWMDPSPPRLHPRQRAAAAATAASSPVTGQRQQQLLLHVTAPAVDDTEDPLTRGLPEASWGDNLWPAAYRRAGDKRLPRQLRVLGWRLLHAAVQVGSSRVYMATTRQQLLQCCCPQPQCQPAQMPQQQQQRQPDQTVPAPGQPAAGGQQQAASNHGQLESQQQSQQQQQHDQLPHEQPDLPLQAQGQPLPAGQQQAAPSQDQPEPQQQQPHQQEEGQPPLPLALAPDSYQLESLSHMFVQCPTAAHAWEWFARLWSRVQPGVQVDVSNVRILLLDDSSVWHPPAALQQLWTYLRLLMLESIWLVRCASNGKPYTSRQVVSRFLAALQQQLKHDWARTQADIRLNCGVPLSWLRGRNPVMSRERFAARWQATGVLYTESGEGGPCLCFDWDNV